MAGMSALALGMPLAAAGGAIMGAVLPDIIDNRIARLFVQRQRVFNQIHRGASHWFGWYVVLMLCIVALPEKMPDMFALLKHMGLVQGKVPHAGAGAGAGQHMLLLVLAGVAYGAITHIILDMLTPSGVPLMPFSRKKKLSLPLCRTGSIGEYVFLGVWMIIFGALCAPRWQELARLLR